MYDGIIIKAAALKAPGWHTISSEHLQSPPVSIYTSTYHMQKKI